MNMQNFLQIDLFLQITPGRLFSIVAGLLGLVSVIIGILALSRSRSRQLAMVALVLGLGCVILGALHLARTTGGFGTGKGRAGAIVAIVIGLIGIVLSSLALARSKRILRRSSGKSE